ncbi:polysaccharide biosynthesis/export family protein [Erythrobacter sp. Dej080120_24]|uniref:polysaccharide biosynthesis/export family protein n=1 Tax=Erythrobacter sp. Dej080120_24 TaxID=3024837 RepID=UPI0030C673F9
MISRTRNFVVTLALLALSGCATDRSVGLAPEVTLTTLETLPPPRGEISYVIGPQEKLEIEVVGAETLSGTYLTDIDARLAFPLVGVLEFDGRTPAEAAVMIAERLRGRYLLDPQVRVIPEEFPVPSISVGGQVKRPGSYPAVGRQTLLRVINQAGGLAEYAQKDDVLILRTVDSERYIGVYNITAIERGNYPDPQLFPNDIVMVGDSIQRRRLDDFLQILPPLLTTSAILITRN